MDHELPLSMFTRFGRQHTAGCVGDIVVKNRDFPPATVTLPVSVSDVVKNPRGLVKFRLYPTAEAVEKYGQALLGTWDFEAKHGRPLHEDVAPTPCEVDPTFLFFINCLRSSRPVSVPDRDPTFLFFIRSLRSLGHDRRGAVSRE